MVQPPPTGVRRPDAAAHLAQRFHRLRHPDGKEYRFAIFNPIGQPDKIVAAQKARAETYSTAMIHELEQEGFIITHRDDAANQPKTGPPPAVTLVHGDKHTDVKTAINFYTLDEALAWLDKQRASIERHTDA